VSHHPALGRACLLAGATLATVAAAALPTTASAQTATELRLEMPRPDPRLRDLVLRVRCSTGCTIRLDRIGFVRYPAGGFGSGEQLPFASEGRLRGTRRLVANQPATFRFALPEPVRAFATSSIAAGEVALATTSVTVTPPGGASYPAISQTAIHLRTTPNRSTAGLDAIALPPEVKPLGRARVRRYAISVKATQRTDWSYQRDEVKGGCKVIDNGQGWQTLTLRTPKPLVARYWREIAWPVLSGGRQSRGFGPDAKIPVRVDAVRDGTRNAGVDGPCSDTVGGDDGTTGPPPACTRAGSRNLDVTMTAYSPAFSAYMAIIIGEPAPEVPDCPFERIRDAYDDYAILPAFRMRDSDPGRAGDPGKFIIVEELAEDHRIEGGSVRTRTRWTITLRRLR
jgi:hypothetical protein